LTNDEATERTFCSVCLKKPARSADDCPRRQNGKEANRMARNAAGRQKGGTPDDGPSPEGPSTVKVTLHLTVGTAQRLGVESAIRRISQSAIAEEVLSAHLSRWHLPEVPEPFRPEAA
jgi:hypothetical protein